MLRSKIQHSLVKQDDDKEANLARITEEVKEIKELYDKLKEDIDSHSDSLAELEAHFPGYDHWKHDPEVDLKWVAKRDFDKKPPLCSIELELYIKSVLTFDLKDATRLESMLKKSKKALLTEEVKQAIVMHMDYIYFYKKVSIETAANTAGILARHGIVTKYYQEMKKLQKTPSGLQAIFKLFSSAGELKPASDEKPHFPRDNANYKSECNAFDSRMESYRYSRKAPLLVVREY